MSCIVILLGVVKVLCTEILLPSYTSIRDVLFLPASFLCQGGNHVAQCLLAGNGRSCIWSWLWIYFCLPLRGLNISLKLVEPLCFLAFEHSLHVLAPCVCMLGESYFLTDL